MTQDPHQSKTDTKNLVGQQEALDRFFQTLRVIVAKRRTILSVSILTSVLTAALVLVSEKEYSSYIRFVPERNGGSDLISSGLLGQLASSFSLGSSEAMVGSPQFYNQLITSRPILEQIVWNRYGIEDNSTALTLIEYLEYERYDSAMGTYYALERLRERWITTTIDDNTGVSTLSVTTPSKQLSFQVSEQLLTFLNLYNIQTRQSSAKEQRRFLGARLDSARVTLTQAEDALRSFREENRVTTSPLLQLEMARLQRQANAQEQLVLTLQQSFESARIDEVRNTPVISVIEAPVPAPRHNTRKGLVKILAALLSTFVVTTGVVVLRSAWNPATLPSSYDDLIEELRGAVPLIFRS